MAKFQSQGAIQFRMIMKADLIDQGSSRRINHLRTRVTLQSKFYYVESMGDLSVHTLRRIVR